MPNELGTDAAGLVTLDAETVDALLDAPTEHKIVARHEVTFGAAGTVEFTLRGSIARGFELWVERSNGKDFMPVIQVTCRPFTGFNGQASPGQDFYELLLADPDQRLRVDINGRAADLQPSYRDPYLRESWYLVTEREPKGTVAVELSGGDLPRTVSFPPQPATQFFGTVPD